MHRRSVYSQRKWPKQDGRLPKQDLRESLVHKTGEVIAQLHPAVQKVLQNVYFYWFKFGLKVEYRLTSKRRFILRIYANLSHRPSRSCAKITGEIAGIYEGKCLPKRERIRRTSEIGRLLETSSTYRNT